ncbi:TM2 domain-containing protein [Ferrimonas sediminicola]|uniref:TM2 domain-containing protein n=1 Tax=Ferrimonas sediminicola TaxID=2569538 RepID=A0A4U1BD05_9GAMM|nr:TM2 domain-containing protein [Ferrimonas sediminicola]TKB48949.1 TM2 domain-containing protein [Ferrimonas sediminicola]
MTENLEQLNRQEEQLRMEIRALTDEQKRRYYALERQQVKDPDTYAALNWCFLAGLHHFYLGEHLKGGINLALMLLGGGLLVLMPGYWGWLPILLVLVMELPQLFAAQQVVHRYNNRVMARCLKRVRSGRE